MCAEIPKFLILAICSSSDGAEAKKRERGVVAAKPLRAVDAAAVFFRMLLPPVPSRENMKYGRAKTILEMEKKQGIQLLVWTTSCE